jgi:hypothetical protein
VLATLAEFLKHCVYKLIDLPGEACHLHKLAALFKATIALAMLEQQRLVDFVNSTPSWET